MRLRTFKHALGLSRLAPVTPKSSVLLIIATDPALAAGGMQLDLFRLEPSFAAHSIVDAQIAANLCMTHPWHQTCEPNRMCRSVSSVAAAQTGSGGAACRAAIVAAASSDHTRAFECTLGSTW